MRQTGTKVLLFSILAVTLGLSIGCRSGGNDKGNGMKPGDNMTNADAEAVQRAKDALRIGYAEGDSESSVTQDVRLPATGENGVAISWESGNSAVVAVPPPPPSSEHITGTVTQPIAADTEVTLTATLTKNDTSDTRSFTLTVILLSCETSGLVMRLRAMPPSLIGCSAANIRGADMPALVSAGVTKEQLLTVWSENRDTGFTPAQLKEAGVTVAEMRSHGLTISQIHTGGVSIADLRSGGVADHLVFNEACDTPETSDTAFARVTLTTTTLIATDTIVMLEVTTSQLPLELVFSEMTGGSLTTLSNTLTILTNINEPIEVGDRFVVTVTSKAPFTSTLSITLANIFLPNADLTVTDGQAMSTTIQLCPGS